eukprot:3042703-Pyramimonas_sp.AAC.1
MRASARDRRAGASGEAKEKKRGRKDSSSSSCHNLKIPRRTQTCCMLSRGTSPKKQRLNEQTRGDNSEVRITARGKS